MEKEFTLKKNLGIYTLYNSDGSTMANSYESPHKLLSVSNCDEIFGVVDINKWANEKVDNRFNETDGYHKFVYVDGIVNGFNKAMELNKDKLFTEDDLRLSIHFGTFGEANGQTTTIEFIQSLQQPTEIEVVIEMIKEEYTLTQNGEGFEDQAYRTWKEVPKLDKNGCIILKRK